MDPTIFLAGAPHKQSGLGQTATTDASTAECAEKCGEKYPETHTFMTKNSILLPGHPAPNYGANLQRSCENISPYGIPPLICGRPFKEAMAAPSLLTGLGLDSSKRLLCSRQRQQERGAFAASTQLSPFAARTDSSTSPSAEVVFDDSFFVTGGGRSDPTEISSGKGAGNHINAKHAIATTTATTGPASSDGRRPRSTPMALPSNQRKLAPLGDPEHTPEGSAVGGLALTRMRRDVWTADGDCLGYRRLRFRSQPIHDLVSATLKSIDPSGVFSMYQEWSNVKNRLLSRGFDEQRSDLALFEGLRKEDEDSCNSEDDESTATAVASAAAAAATAAADAGVEEAFPEGPSPPGGGSVGGDGDGALVSRDEEEEEAEMTQKLEQDRANDGLSATDPAAENQDRSEDLSAKERSPNDMANEARASGTTTTAGATNGVPPPRREGGSSLAETDDPAALRASPVPENGSAANRPATWLAHHDHDVQLVGAGSDNGIVARRRRRRRRRRQEEPRLSQQEGRAANLDYARNLHQDPGLPPLRVLRESGRGALRLAHMALGNPHVMALMHSLDHLRSLTSIDVADNRIGSAAIQTVVSVAEEKGVTHLDLSWNHVDRPSADMISAYLARSGSLSSLVLKSSGVSDVAGAKMMAAVADNTTLKILDLSGNNIGGTSDLLATHHLHEQGLSAASSAGGSGAAGEGGRLTGGAAIAMALDTNYSLTHLDLGWNKIGGTNAAIIGSAIENNQELRWLGLAGNRVGDEGAFSLAKALGVNYTLAHLDVSFNGISREGAAALAHGLAENASVENIQINGNSLGWAGGRALFRTVNASEISRTIGIRDCDFGERDLNAFDPRFPGGQFDLDLSKSSQRAAARETILAVSYRTGCSLAEVQFFESSESRGEPNCRVLELVRPSPDAPILQPRGDTTTASLGDDPVKFCARTWPDQRAAMEDLLLRTDGDREPWRLPPAGRLAGSVDFQPLPPCAAIMCNASGLQGILRAMGGCTETRGEAFRLFATDLFFTTDQVQWLIEQFAEGPSPLNNAEVLEMMAAVAPQIYDNAGLPDLIERNLSPMGRRLLVAQLGQAYPAFTGGVSGPFVLDLRFPAHRLAAVRLAEAENIQQRERIRHLEEDRERLLQQQQQQQQQQQAAEGRQEEEEKGEGHKEEGTLEEQEEKKNKQGGDREKKTPPPSDPLGLWCGFRNARYKPTRATTTATAAAAAAAAAAATIDNVDDFLEDGEEGPGGSADDATGAATTAQDKGSGDGNGGDGGKDEAAATAATVAAAEAAAIAASRGLGEPLATFFQRGLRDKPNGVLQLDFVCTSRPPEGTQPISDLELARLLNSCGMLDPNYWSEYLRPTNFPVSFVDLIRLLRVKGRGDRRQAKLLVLLLRVKNSMWRTARDEIKREGTNQSRRWRIGRVLSAHRGPTSTQRGTSTIVSAAMANLAARMSKPVAAGDATVVTAGTSAAGAAVAASAAETALPLGSGGDIGAGISVVDGSGPSPMSGGNAVSSSTAVTPSAITSTINPSSSKHSRKSKALGASQRLSTMHRVIKSFPNSRSNSGSERTLDGDGEVAGGGGAAVVATDNELGAEHEEQELTPVQAAVVATDKRLEDLLNAGGILRAQGRRTRLHVFPPRTPAWGEKDGVTGIGVKTSLGGIGRAGADVSDDFRSVGASASVCALGIDDDDDSGGGGDGVAEMEERAVVDWARRFCEPECEFPAYETEDGFRLGRALARHVVRDRDAGLLGTRPPTLLVHGLCIRVKHRESGRVLRVKHRSTTGSNRNRMDADKPSRHQDEWAAVVRQGVRGSHLRVGTKKEVASALAAIFASQIQERYRTSGISVGSSRRNSDSGDGSSSSRTSSSINVTPRTLGTLNMSEDEEWRDVFVPSDLYASTSPEESGSLHLRLLVTFVEVSARFLPSDCLTKSEITAVDHQGNKTTYEWVASNQAPEVVNTSVEPDLSRSLAQLRARLGGCWLSSAQATSVASVVPRVLGGRHYRIDAVAFLFSRVVDLHNYRQVMETLHENKRPQLSPRLGDLDALCPAAAPAPTPSSAPAPA